MTTVLLSNGGPPLDDDDSDTPPWGFGSCAPSPLVGEGRPDAFSGRSG